MLLNTLTDIQAYEFEVLANSYLFIVTADTVQH